MRSKSGLSSGKGKAYAGAELETLFELWKGKHGKAYAGAEHKMRLETFCVSMKEIQTINAIPGGTWRAAPNPYRSSQRPIDDHLKPNMMTHPHAHTPPFLSHYAPACALPLSQYAHLYTLIDYLKLYTMQQTVARAVRYCLNGQASFLSHT